MGQVASSGLNNLAFYARKRPIETPVSQVPYGPALAYNKSKTYVSIVMGDGRSKSPLATENLREVTDGLRRQPPLDPFSPPWKA